jgi:hypothetical protein
MILISSVARPFQRPRHPRPSHEAHTNGQTECKAKEARQYAAEMVAVVLDFIELLDPPTRDRKKRN